MEIDFDKLAEKPTIAIKGTFKPAFVEIIDTLVEMGLFLNRTEFLREACKDKIKDVIAMLGKGNEGMVASILASQSEESLEKIKRILELLEKLSN